MFLPPNMRNIAENIEESLSHVEPLGISDDIHGVLCKIEQIQQDMKHSEEQIYNEINAYKQSDAIKTKKETVRYWITTAISLAALIVAIVALLKQ